MKKLVIARRLSQGLFFIVFVTILWSTTYPLRGVVSPRVIFYLDPLVSFFTAVSERALLPGLFFSGFMILATLIAGRFFCGWVCPLGTVIDASGALTGKKYRASDAANAKIRTVKWFILAGISALSLLGVQAVWVLDPLVVTARFVSLNLIPTVTVLADRLFIGIIKMSNYYEPFYDLYRALKSSILGIKVYYFANAGAIFLFFLCVVLLSLVMSRAWCRALCPLGAVYALVSRFAPVRRIVEKCTACGICKSTCRMGAIKDDTSYVKGECILCMDCVYDCPGRVTRFGLPVQEKNDPAPGNADGVSRRHFLLLAASSLFLPGCARQGKGGLFPTSAADVIRPPGVTDEKTFLNRCIRCGNCMKVCVTNGLQPVMLQSGLQGIWTPQLVPEVGYCEYNCTLCGNVCPTTAIPKLPLEEKRRARLGTARVDRSLCLPWSQDRDCIVCEEHCPVPTKAIKVVEEVAGGRRLQKPVVDEKLCIGCGICQYKCPVRPRRAITVRSAVS